MKLVTFHNFISKKEVTVNCDHIAFIIPNETFENKTEVNFIGTGNYLILQEDYEEVKKRLKNAR